jgi:hypothetical protein
MTATAIPAFAQQQADQLTSLLNYLWSECEEYSYITENYDTYEEALAAYQNGECGLAQTILALNEHLYGVSAAELIRELY